jgi:hypothetical protein
MSVDGASQPGDDAQHRLAQEEGVDPAPIAAEPPQAFAAAPDNHEHALQRQERVEGLAQVQSGHDGGAWIARCEKEHYVWEENGSSKDNMVDRLLRVMLIKGEKSYSEEQVRAMLEALRDDPDLPQTVRANIPHSFKSMMHALEQLLGMPPVEDTCDYDICPCGDLYR